MVLIYTYLFLACVFLIPLYRLVDIPRLMHHSIFLVFNPIYTGIGLDLRFVLFWVPIYLVGLLACIGSLRIADSGELRQKIRILTRTPGIMAFDYLVLIFVPILIGIALFLRFLSEPLLCTGFILIIATVFDQISVFRFSSGKGGRYGKLISVAFIGLLILALSLSLFAYLFPLDIEKTFQQGQRHHFISQKDKEDYYWRSTSGREVKLGKSETESILYLKQNTAVLEDIKDDIRERVTAIFDLAISHDLVVQRKSGYYYYRRRDREQRLAWERENTIRHLIEHADLVDKMDERIVQ